MSGLGTTARDYASSCPGATIGQGLAVQGEKVQDAGPDIEPGWTAPDSPVTDGDPLPILVLNRKT